MERKSGGRIATARAVGRDGVAGALAALRRNRPRRFPSRDRPLASSIRYFTEEQTWPALYTGEGLHVCLGEILRNAADDRVRLFRYTELRLRLTAVLDCRVAAAFGLEETAFLEDLDFTAPQDLASAARRIAAEALYVRSASLLGDNVVIFPDRLRPDSLVEEIRFLDPHLVKHR